MAGQGVEQIKDKRRVWVKYLFHSNPSTIYMEIDLELLSIQNPWWTKLGKPERPGQGLKFDPVIEAYSRQALKWQPDFLSEIDLRHDNIYILRGTRGVGKTTILKLLIKKLIDEKDINPDDIFYYSCHNLDTYEQLNELIKIFLTWRKLGSARYKKSSNRVDKDRRLFIFIDEITLIKDWSRGIDFLVKAKRLKNTTVVLTGSILHNYKYKQKDFGAQDKIITSLDFPEFIQLINFKLKNKINSKNYLKYQNQLEYYLDIYFLTGGFISAINSFKENGAVKQSIYSNFLYWLIADIAKLGRDIILMRQILEQTLLNLGQPIGYKTIARRTKAKTHLTVAEYLDILELMFATKMVYQSDPDSKPTSRKAKKVYFRDPFLFWLFYSYIYGSIDYWQFSRERLHREDIFSALVDNVVFSHLIKDETIDTWGERVTYWRDNMRRQEINFLVRQVRREKKVVPILIRYNQTIKDTDKKTFKQAGFKQGIIISKDKLDLTGSIKVMPLTYFLMFWREYLR